MSAPGKKLELLDKKLSDYTIHWVVIAVKLIPAVIAFLCNLAVRKLICPFVRCLPSRSSSGTSGGTSSASSI